jgi:putative CocE/NonD family hydrolase
MRSFSLSALNTIRRCRALSLGQWPQLLLALAMAIFITQSALAAPDVRVERNVAVPMRDGVILRADVYRPSDDGPYPVLVMRTPYGKQGKNFNAFVAAGYIVVCQDARGRYESDGKFESLVQPDSHDGEDGYDTVEWAAKLPGGTGKVGTFGTSYNSFLQWKLAALRPPSLVAMSAHSIPARYTDLEGPGTIRPGRRLKWWFSTLSPDMRRRADRPGSHTTAEAVKLWDGGEDQKLLKFLPWLDLPDYVCEDEAEAVRNWLRRPHTDPWQLDKQCREIDVPNFDVVGWYDHCNGHMALHRAMVAEGRTEAARHGQRIMIGPWSHASLGKGKYGDIDFGPAANVNLEQAEIRWFDYRLKGKDNGVDRDAPVKIYVMGAGCWRDEQEWPLRRSQPLELFLNSDGKANTPAGDGRLARDSRTAAVSDRYRYDPRDPVPTLWTKELFTIPANQRPLAARQDILVYQTEPLTEPLEVTGYPELVLYASSSAPDTDFFARLIDVAPDGVARDISMGMVRGRYRNSLDKEELLEPNRVTKFVIRLNPTSNEFQPGHRIRLDITSSDFPNYDRNHNTAADQNADAELHVADQTIHHGGANLSKLILPVIPRK